jgi:hypothetical protein
VATDAVPTRASSGSIIQALWFRFFVRTALALLALAALSVAADRYEAFGLDAAANFRFDDWLWLSWIGATVTAGLLFGLAAWLPFTRFRYEWSRLLLAALPLAPIVQFWWVWLYHHGAAGGWLVRADWLTDATSQSVLAALAGVAIASGFRAKDSTPAAA